MSMTDPIADLLTRIRNGIRAKHQSVDIPASNMKREIVRILKEEGFIESYSFSEDNKQGMLRVQLRYTASKKSVITSLGRVSRPGCRVYAKKSEVPTVLGGMGICIVSTSGGVLTGKQATARGVGGEVLCAVS